MDIEIKNKYDNACKKALAIEGEMVEIYNKINDDTILDKSQLFIDLSEKRRELISAKSEAYELDKILQGV